MVQMLGHSPRGFPVPTLVPSHSLTFLMDLLLSRPLSLTDSERAMMKQEKLRMLLFYLSRSCEKLEEL